MKTGPGVFLYFIKKKFHFLCPTSHTHGSILISKCISKFKALGIKQAISSINALNCTFPINVDSSMQIKTQRNF